MTQKPILTLEPIEAHPHPEFQTAVAKMRDRVAAIGGARKGFADLDAKLIAARGRLEELRTRLEDDEKRVAQEQGEQLAANAMGMQSISEPVPPASLAKTRKSISDAEAEISALEIAKVKAPELFEKLLADLRAAYRELQAVRADMCKEMASKATELGQQAQWLVERANWLASLESGDIGKFPDGPSLLTDDAILKDLQEYEQIKAQMAKASAPLVPPPLDLSRPELRVGHTQTRYEAPPPDPQMEAIRKERKLREEEAARKDREEKEAVEKAKARLERGPLHTKLSGFFSEEDRVRQAKRDAEQDRRERADAEQVLREYAQRKSKHKEHLSIITQAASPAANNSSEEGLERISEDADGEADLHLNDIERSGGLVA